MRQDDRLPHPTFSAQPRAWQSLRASTLRTLAAFVVPIALWWAVVLVARPEPFILPGPDRVARAFVTYGGDLFWNSAVTTYEMLIGLAAGCLFGIAMALLMAAIPTLGRAAMPVIVVTQSLPVFAIAPLLVLWFGFGLASKIVMATTVIFFPVTASFHDGLTRADAGLLDLADLYRASRWQRLRFIQLPAAMPGLVSGLRMAATIAPIGAIVGEWVGASSGLGLVMIHANARLMTDLMFAALAILIAIALVLRLAVDWLTRDLVHWNPEFDR